MNIMSDLTTFIVSQFVRALWLINLAGLKLQYIPLKWTSLFKLKPSPSMWTQSYGK